MHLVNKSRLWVVCALVGMFHVSAQAISTDFGLKAGMDLHTGSFDTTRSTAFSAAGTEVNFGVGLVGGLAAEWHFSDLISLESNFLWVTRGNVLATTAGGIETVVHSGYNTLALPVLVKLSFGSWDFIPYLGVGVEPYYIISAGSTTTVTNLPATTASINLGTFNRLNLGIVGNIGFAYFWGDVGGSFDIRYTYTITNVAKGAATDDLKNQDIVAIIGAIFRL